MKTMRDVIRILENADFDHREHDVDDLHTFDYREFSDKGRAGLDTRGVYPRGDNALADVPDGDEIIIDIEEDVGSIEPDPIQLDRLHQMLNKELKQTDQAIRKGPINLDDNSKHNLAGRLGVSVEDVEALLNTLTQKMRDEQGEEEENKLLLTSLSEEYHKMMREIALPQVMREAAAERVRKQRALDRERVDEQRFYAEPDSLGNLTVRDSQTGNSKFIQGGQASEIAHKLKSGANQDVVLARLFEKATNPEADNFHSEIGASSGTFNFPWHLGPAHGFATVYYNQDKKLQLQSVMDMSGEEVDLDNLPGLQRKQLVQQAREFINSGDV